MEANGRAEKSASTFRMQCGVAIRIQAPAGRVWALLTNAADFPRWSSTVTNIGGKIALGEKLAVTVPLAPGRTFKPKVTELEAEQRMVWSNGAAPMFKGVRSYTLTPKDGGVEFAMVEVFSGLMLPLIKKSLPDFAPAFEQYATDLKREAERSA
jgi:hypothetical protein